MRLLKVARSVAFAGLLAATLLTGVAVCASPEQPMPPASIAFIDQNCASCHDDIEKKGNLDLTSLKLVPSDPQNFAKWVMVHDRVSKGEMPPKKKPRPDQADQASFIGSLAGTLETAERATLGEGRATQRRLNRYEYENALRDLLGAPWLQVKNGLPEDGEKYRFNKIGDTLDLSYVNMARYLTVAETALRQVIAQTITQPESKTTRYYTRDQKSFTNKMAFNDFNQRPERATFPVVGTQSQPEVRAGKAPLSDPATREDEAVAVVASAYEPIEPVYEKFRARVTGHYKIRINAYSLWVGPSKPVPGKQDRWWIPDFDDVSPGRRPEPIVVYSETRPRLLRRLGAFDAGVEPTVGELDVYLLAGEMIRPDSVRLFRSRPSNYQNPLATHDGQPGVAFKWMEIEGPLMDQWPSKGHSLMFGDLPLKIAEAGKTVEAVSKNPAEDAPRLLKGFLAHAYRHPISQAEVDRFMPVINIAMKAGSSFTDAMIAGYTAVLSSPGFLFLEETPGKLTDYAVASRLSFFLWNTSPDVELLAVAARGDLRSPAVLRAQTDRMLADPKSRQFVNAFLDYWLDLRKVQTTSPDTELYNDYYLDDALIESSIEETQLFFSELIRADLPARNLVASDFAFLNERLAVHYGLPPVEGVNVRRVRLPADSVRGGLLTQASVLKVTANGTTTSPVIRGAWIMERILGMPPPPPPPNLPAVEPDIRGATTLRQQLDKHRNEESCGACHARIDPPGFALESFDVMGGQRTRYRAITEGVAPEPGIGKGGLKFTFHYALPVDSAGVLWDGRPFSDIRDFKQLLLNDERMIARNLLKQLAIYATGAPVRFTDRNAVESILSSGASGGYGVRTLVHGLVQSDLFLNK